MTRRDSRLSVIVAWLPAALYTLLIWWLSSQSLDLAIIEQVPLQDKGVHALEYGAMGFFIAHAVTTTWPGRRALGTLVAILITVSLGLLDELHQAFVPGRSSEVLDLVADTVGAVVAALLYVGIRRGLGSLRGRCGAGDLTDSLQTAPEDAPEHRPSRP